MILGFSCKNDLIVPKDISLVLERAGNNKDELEEVIRHFSADEKDSLKLKAVFFLIKNIDGLKTLDTTNTDKKIYFDSLNQIWKTNKKKLDLSVVATVIDSINQNKQINSENFTTDYLS